MIFGHIDRHNKSTLIPPITTMADLLGGNNIDEFERAANAFPDISLDGFGDLPSAPAANQISNSNSAGFSFDDFDTPLAPSGRPVRVTGDDELEKFENEFPDIEVPSAPAVQVCFFSPVHRQFLSVCFSLHLHNLCFKSINPSHRDLSLLHSLRHQCYLSQLKGNQK